MKLSDVSHGPDWVIWVIFALFVFLTVVFLSGHGGGLIAGYNTSSEKEKQKYNEKKLCRVCGAGMAVISVLILITGLLEECLPMEFAYVMMGIILADVVILMILMNTICRK